MEKKTQKQKRINIKVKRFNPILTSQNQNHDQPPSPTTTSVVIDSSITPKRLEKDYLNGYLSKVISFKDPESFCCAQSMKGICVVDQGRLVYTDTRQLSKRAKIRKNHLYLSGKSTTHPKNAVLAK